MELYHCIERLPGRSRGWRFHHIHGHLPSILLVIIDLTDIPSLFFNPIIIVCWCYYITMVYKINRIRN
jgi:hypothetical protein